MSNEARGGLPKSAPGARIGDGIVRSLSSHNLALSAQNLPPRGIILAGAVAAAILLITVLSIVLARDSAAAIFWLDHGSNSSFPYPFTIQNGLHLLLALGLGELFVRHRVASWEQAFLRKQFLPEDDRTVLQAGDLGPIRLKVAKSFDGDAGFLPYLIDLSILQFQSSKSVDQTVSVLNSSLELIQHRVDLRYSAIRYLVWAIPTIGFIGTVVGIAGALKPQYINQDNIDITGVSAQLGVAFNTTIIALIFSAILVFLLHGVQKREETSVNMAGNYCLKNLINRLYVGG